MEGQVQLQRNQHSSTALTAMCRGDTETGTLNILPYQSVPSQQVTSRPRRLYWYVCNCVFKMFV